MKLKKCIIVSDSFKGTLSSNEICDIATDCFSKYFPDCSLIKVPVADGGEGTVDSFHKACGGCFVTVPVKGPYGEIVRAKYLQLPHNRAIVEMSAAAGLPLVEGHKNPGRTSTYGVGELIRHAVEHGNKSIYLGLGGSCTNDGGCGCAAALGVQFTKKDGSAFVPTGETLDQIYGIDLRLSKELLRDVQLIAMCDIDNPLYGPTGAAYVFAPQKGADATMVEFLDQQLIAFDSVLQTQLGCSVGERPGAGAAGGLGAGVAAFFGAELQPGIDVVMDVVNFDEILADCDLIITGEGQLDWQSIRGKVVSGIAKRAKRHNIPVIAIVGGVTPDIEDICDDPSIGINAVFPINRQAIDFEYSRKDSRENYTYTLNSILRLLRNWL